MNSLLAWLLGGGGLTAIIGLLGIGLGLLKKIHILVNSNLEAVKNELIKTEQLLKEQIARNSDK